MIRNPYALRSWFVNDEERHDGPVYSLLPLLFFFFWQKLRDGAKRLRKSYGFLRRFVSNIRNDRKNETEMAKNALAFELDNRSCRRKTETTGGGNRRKVVPRTICHHFVSFTFCWQGEVMLAPFTCPLNKRSTSHTINVPPWCCVT